MTFRAKPVVKRSRNQWESQDRKNFYTNLAFGLVVVAAILILIIATAVAWYGDHLAAVGRVDGQAITKDELRDRVAIENWRLDESTRRVATQAAAGRLTEEQASSEREFIDSQRQSIDAIALERIIDNRIQARLAVEEGVTVGEADIDAQLVEEATVPATRHAWVIEVEPAISDGAVEPTTAQIAEARTKATSALDELKAGKPWEDVAKTVSTDSTTREQGGDLGWIQAEDAVLEEELLGTLFELEAEMPSDVIEGADGTFRIGRVTEIQEATVDDLYQTKLTSDGIDLAKYREVVRGDVVRTRLEDKIVADVIKPGPQRRVQELYLAAPQEEVVPEAVKVRHILYSPNDTPPNAESPLPSDDPAWAEAETEARAAYDRLTEDPSLFDQIARTESDETSALGTTGSGGKLGVYIAPDEVRLVQEFVEAISAPGLEDGQILEPVRTEFGWHVIQIMYRPPDLDQLEKLKALADGGADFGQLARDFSESQTGGAGGDIGWVAKGQLDDSLTVAIFGAPVGETTQVVAVEADGSYLFKVLEEQVRTPEGRQLEELRSTAFNDWYTEKKGAVDIQRGEDGADTEDI
jgi:parvulin-like peptidyl-prolyl isomerase